MKRSFFGLLLLVLTLGLTSCDNSSEVFDRLKTAIDRDSELLEEEISPEEALLAEEPDSVIPPPPEPVETAPIINKDARVAILGYHDFIEGKSTNDMKMDVLDFRDQMQAIKDAQIPVISMQQFLAWKRGEEDIPDECVMITIDDGWKATHTLAMPVLKEFEFPFTVFLYKKYVGVGGRSMTHDEIRDLQKNGGTVACHSVSHQDLRSKRGKSDEDYLEWVRSEFEDSMVFLEENFAASGEVIRTFAYPYGFYNETCVEIATELGYEAAFTVNGKKTEWEVEDFEIGRYIVMGKTGANFGSALSFGGPDGLATGRKLLNESRNEEGELEEALVVTRPAQGESITDRMPLIEVDVSKLENVKPLAMRVSGIGTVPFEYDTEAKVIRYQVPQRLRTESNKVVVYFSHSGSSDSEAIAWNFKLDLLGDYLPEGYDRPEKSPVTEEEGDDISPPTTASLTQ